MEIVILAAGKGSRFGKGSIQNKCFIKINKQTLIEKILHDTKKLNIYKIRMIIGHNSLNVKKKLAKYKLHFLYNKFFKVKDMMYSLKLAFNNQKEDMIILYSDIYFSDKILKKLIAKLNKSEFKNNICLPIKSNWKSVWKKRNKEIIDDCESLIYKKNDLKNIGSKIKNIKDVMGQYMGIIYFPLMKKKKILNIIKKIDINKMHITEFLNLLIKKSIPIKIVKTNDFWYEFDDLADLKNFHD